MAVKRVKVSKKKAVEPLIEKKVPLDARRKRVSFAKQLTESKVIEDDVNVSQNFDVTPRKSILKSRKRPAESDQSMKKIKSDVTVASDGESSPPKKLAFDDSVADEEPLKPVKKIKSTKILKPKKKIMVKKSIKEKLLAMGHKERKEFLKELKAKSKPNYNISVQAKQLWEIIRSRKTAEDKKNEAIDDLVKLVKGSVAKLIHAHDTVRVIQCLLALRRDDIRDFLFDELQTEMIAMAKSKYGKFFVMRMLKYGTAAQRQAILRSFDGHCPSLFRITYSASVLERAYSDFCSAANRESVVCEFYGKEYAMLKKTGQPPTTIADVLKMDRAKQKAIATSLFENLGGIVVKENIRYSLTHKLLRDFFTICTKEQRSEMIDLLKEIVPQFCHTLDGCRAALHCIWHSGPKERKIIVKTFKDLVINSCKDEFAYRVLLGIFDCVDDTTLINKYITMDIANYIADVMGEKYGMWVLHYIVHPRDYRFFKKSSVGILKEGDDNDYTKKEPAVRYKAIFDCLKKPLLTYMAANMKDLLMNKMTATLVLNVLEPPVPNEPFTREIDDEDKIACFKAIAEVVGDEFVPFNLEGNTHIIEAGAGRFALTNLLKRDSNQDTVKLSDYLADLPPDHLGSFIAVNNGCFVLLNMCKSGSEKAFNAVKKAVSMKALKKSPHVGAAYLVETLGSS